MRYNNNSVVYVPLYIVRYNDKHKSNHTNGFSSTTTTVVSSLCSTSSVMQIAFVWPMINGRIPMYAFCMSEFVLDLPIYLMIYSRNLWFIYRMGSTASGFTKINQAWTMMVMVMV